MPTVRTPINRRHLQGTYITPEMVQLYARASAIRRAGKHEVWEENGGRRREWHNCRVELHRMLGRKLWQHDVISDYLPDQLPATETGVGDQGDLAGAHEARNILEAHVLRGVEE
jgi:hypothetical protein